MRFPTTTTTPSSNNNKRQFLLSLLTLAAATDAFTSPHVSSSVVVAARHHPHQHHRDAHYSAKTRLYVGGKWHLPFLAETHDDDEESSGIEASTITPSCFMPSFFQHDTAEGTQEAMGDLVHFMPPSTSTTTTDETKGEMTTSEDEEAAHLVPLLGAVAVAVALLAVGAGVSGMIPTSDIAGNVESFFQDPTSSMEQVTDMVASMGPLGPLYFGAIYVLAEVLAIPAVPLTASAGYLFGVSTGTLVVLVSASIAASISFVIGRTLLRTTVEQAMSNYPQFAKMDKAIGREGFKLMFLLRLSPLFPFALSNYLYGATSIDFASFFWGTLFGFAPGTLAYVYTGVVGKALTLGGDGAQPWYVYAGGAALLGGFLKVLVDVASNIVQEIEDEEADMES